MTRLGALGGLIIFLGAGLGQAEKKQKAVEVSAVAKSASKDKSLNSLVRLFEQADAIHREAWWVLSSDRRPIGKSPFGKVQRALLSSQNVKLSNKSLFRCDRYLVKRDIMSLQGFPQQMEVFEKCSEKQAAKKIAQVSAASAKDIQVTFYPENLEEILGLGATVINKSIQCVLKGNEQEQLLSLNCKDWAQDRSKEHLIRLDTYEYQKAGKNLIKLRGKVYENLSDIRKISADVPLDGKIEVVETELYPAEPVPTPTPKTSPTPVKAPVVAEPAPAPIPEAPAVPAQITPLPGSPTVEHALPPPRENVVDPDVLMQQSQMQEENQDMEGVPQAPVPPSESSQPAEPPAAGGVYHGR